MHEDFCAFSVEEDGSQTCISCGYGDGDKDDGDEDNSYGNMKPVAIASPLAAASKSASRKRPSPQQQQQHNHMNNHWGRFMHMYNDENQAALLCKTHKFPNSDVGKKGNVVFSMCDDIAINRYGYLKYLKYLKEMTGNNIKLYASDGTDISTYELFKAHCIDMATMCNVGTSKYKTTAQISVSQFPHL
jgi:hypothetical protein